MSSAFTSLPSCLHRSLLVALMSGAILTGTAFVTLPTVQAIQTQSDDAVSCSLTPLTLPLFAATPPADLATPLAATPASDVARKPTAEEASDIQSGVATLVACINTGNPRLVYAIFSERYLATQYADPAKAYLPAFEQKLDGPTVPVEPPFVLVGVTRIQILADDRAKVTVTISQMQESWTSTLTLVRIDGAWLIDGVE